MMTRNFARRLLLTLAFLAGASSSTGCVQSQYRYGVSNASTSLPHASALPPSSIIMGGEYPRLDKLETTVHAIPTALRRIFARKSGSSDKSFQELQEESLALSMQYLSANGIDDIHVDVRRYEPAEQWHRLCENDGMGPIWKYTGGSFSVLMYTLLPQRALRRDVYNPYTNTLSLNSARPANALYEAGSAKQFQSVRWRGSYAVAQNLPIVPLLHATRVASDVLTYSETSQLWEVQEDLYPTAYSKVTASAVTQVLYVVPHNHHPDYVVPAIRVALRGVGKLTGTGVSKFQEHQRASQADVATD